MGIWESNKDLCANLKISSNYPHFFMHFVHSKTKTKTFPQLIDMHLTNSNS